VIELAGKLLPQQVVAIAIVLGAQQVVDYLGDRVDKCLRAAAA
jgi:hypothetical protein